MTTSTDALNQQPDSDILISIIMPAYNSEKFIAHTLDSLINQDYPEKNYEIIITDDGSKDSTGKICDDYAARYSFVHVTHTENSGPSHARNIALSQVKGKYITFCDSDDEVSPQLISIITKTIEKYHPDMFNFQFLYTFPKEGWPVYDFNKINVKPNDVYKDIPGFTCNKIISRELVNNVKFDEELFFCEDMHWFLRILTPRRDIRAFSLDCRLYHYYQRPGSISKSRTLRNLMNLLLSFEKQLSVQNITERASEQLKACLYTTSADILFFHGRKSISPETYEKLKSYIRKYRFNCYFGPFPNFKRKIKTFVKCVLSCLGINRLFFKKRK